MPSERRLSMVVTCEHGGNRVPAELRRFFRTKDGRGLAHALQTHRGWDPGALQLARDLAAACAGSYGVTPMHAATISRLVVDLNRSPDNPDRWSRYTMKLDAVARQEIEGRYYTPYRTSVERSVAAGTSRGRACLHLSVHSFTPVLRGVRRKTDIGVLFDPTRRFESVAARALSREIKRLRPRLVVEMNSPYKGTDDGLTTCLRREHGDGKYAGIELEVSQRLVRSTPARWSDVRSAIVEAVLGTVWALELGGCRS